eukprot:3314703-Prymnesium_polylepis.1
MQDGSLWETDFGTLHVTVMLPHVIWDLTCTHNRFRGDLAAISEVATARLSLQQWEASARVGAWTSVRVWGVLKHGALHVDRGGVR